LCGLQHTNLLICHLDIIIKSLHVLLHLTHQSLRNTIHAMGLWWCVLVIIRQTCHGKVHINKEKKQ
jgi:hypothetical protein